MTNQELKEDLTNPNAIFDTDKWRKSKIAPLIEESLILENRIDSYKAAIFKLSCPSTAEAVEDLLDMLIEAACELEDNNNKLVTLGVNATEQRKLQAEYLDQHKK